MTWAGSRLCCTCTLDREEPVREEKNQDRVNFPGSTVLPLPHRPLLETTVPQPASRPRVAVQSSRCVHCLARWASRKQIPESACVCMRDNISASLMIRTRMQGTRASPACVRSTHSQEGGSLTQSQEWSMPNLLLLVRLRGPGVIL